ncbi:MAG: hypothetical protein ABIF10_06985 [Candidatus Woesearchaeota archaeon]
MEDKIEFVPKMCPTCKEPLAVKWLGVWGYYCTDCMFWWGTYDPWPKLKKPKPKKAKKK